MDVDPVMAPWVTWGTYGTELGDRLTPGCCVYALINKQLLYSFNSHPCTFALSTKCLDGVPRGGGYSLWDSRSTPRLLSLLGQPRGRWWGRRGGPGHSQGPSRPPEYWGDGGGVPGLEDRPLPGGTPQLQCMPWPPGRCSWPVGCFALQDTLGEGMLQHGAAGKPQGSAGRSHLCLGLPLFSHISS